MLPQRPRSTEGEPLPRDSPRILLLRTSALGDIVHCLPVLSALRQQYPSAHIGWVVEEAFAPLLADHELLDEVLAVGSRPWRRAPFAPRTLRELAAFVRQLRRFAPDAVLDLMGNHKAGVLARLSGSARRIGARREDRREPSSAMWITEAAGVTSTHAVDRALDLLAAVGIDDPIVEFRPDALLPRPSQLPSELTAGFVLVQAGAGWGNKRYPATLWGQVARVVRDATGRQVVAIHGPGEQLLARTVAESSDGAAMAVAAPTLADLVASMRQAALVLGGDTGPVHLAHALGRPVLCLMGPTDPDRHGPYGAPERALLHRLPCSFCYRRMDNAKICLLELSPERVAAAAVALLQPELGASVTPN